MLKTEVQVMREHLRRLEPNGAHIYGHFTSTLNQQQQQGNGGNGMALPPMNTAQGVGQGSGTFNGVAAPAAMQGVEYGGGYAR